MEQVAVLIMLGICSYSDIKSKQIPVIQLCVFGILGVIMHLFNSQQNWISLILGIGIGAILYVYSLLSQEKLGKGDAMIVMVIGIYMGFMKTLELLWISSIFAAGVGIVMIIYKKQKKNYEIPFVPFLMAGYLYLLAHQAIAGIAV